MREISSASKLILSLLLCLGIGFLSGFISQSEINTWYATLHKPWWTPPSFIFAPVWVFLYILMGIAFWRVWKVFVVYVNKKNAISLFIVQLFFNFCWSLLFFKYHSPALAFADSIMLWISILFTILSFSIISRLAAWLMVPYLAWVSYATLLNYAIWNMN